MTRYFFLYLLRQALNQDQTGKDLCSNPAKFISIDRTKMKAAVTAVVRDLIVDFNAEIRDRISEGNAFDYKRELKSPKAIRDLAHNIIPIYQKAISRGRASSFGGEWAS